MPMKALIVSAVANELLRLGMARRLVWVGLLAAMASGLPAPSPARAQAPGLSLVLSLNQSVFGPGTTLEVTLGVAHAGPPVVVDLLFGAILADGESVVFLECGLPLLLTASALRSEVLSRLNTRPARSPVNVSPSPLPTRTHDSGPVWVADPSPYDSFIRNTSPV